MSPCLYPVCLLELPNGLPQVACRAEDRPGAGSRRRGQQGCDFKNLDCDLEQGRAGQCGRLLKVGVLHAGFHAEPEAGAGEAAWQSRAWGAREAGLEPGLGLWRRRAICPGKARGARRR